jgi:glycosyltransferase involved in cell wall biosynthesis
MKVLHLYSGNMYGGVETLLTTIAEQCHLCSEMQPEFALCFQGQLAENLQAAGVPLHVFSARPRYSRPWTIVQVQRQFQSLLQQKNYDIVLCHGVWIHAMLGLVVKANQIPLVLRIPDLPTGQHWLERLAKRVQPDLVISNSRFTATAIPKLYPDIPCRVVYNPLAAQEISAEARRQMRQDLQVAPEQTVILQVSRLERWKGQTLLLAALALLQDQPDWVCWIVGGPQRPHEAKYLQELQQRVQQMGLGNRVKFLGQRYDIPELLAAADIFCQPNIEPEPFGNIFVEALYAGLPVVTTAMGGGQEIVTADCGRLVSAQNPPALASSLNELLSQPLLRKDLGTFAKERAAALCDPARQLNELYQALREI